MVTLCVSWGRPVVFIIRRMRQTLTELKIDAEQFWGKKANDNIDLIELEALDAKPLGAKRAREG